MSGNPFWPFDKKKLEHFATTGIMEGKQRETILDGPKKWLKVGQVTDSLKGTRDRMQGQAMIDQAKEHST